MKNMKSILALLVAVCMLMCLAVSAFATETTGSAETTGSTETSAAADDTTAAADDTAAATDDTTAATDDTTGADDHDHDHEDATTTGAEEEGGFRKIARIVLIVLEVIVSLVLILVVLFQSGKESGLSGAISGNSDSYLSKKGGNLDKTLATATKWVALVWVFVTLALSLI